MRWSRWTTRAGWPIETANTRGPDCPTWRAQLWKGHGPNHVRPRTDELVERYGRRAKLERGPMTEPARQAAPTRRLNSKTVPAYETERGAMYHADIAQWLDSGAAEDLRGKLDLIITSPPFPLANPKKYGNKVGDDYLRWLADLAPRFGEMLSDTGSLVIEIGNSWESRRPVMSTLPLEALLAIQKAGDFNLCQQFICHNPARLPGPAQWVTIERIRVKDSYTHVWWLSRTERPKADNKQVLVPYSDRMKALLKRGRYNAGARPSGHVLGEASFLTDNGGAIPPNVLEISNTGNGSQYVRHCKAAGVPAHPARMPEDLIRFFLRLLTQEGDLVLDPFAGSNTTGAVSEAMGRQWIGVEQNMDYIVGSRGRFPVAP
jgi:DNA modification methylase